MSEQRASTILVALDFSRSSLVALSLGVELARVLQCHFVLAHVFSYMPRHGYAVPVGWMVRELRDRAEHHLERARIRVAQSGQHVETRLLDGELSPGAEIMQLAETLSNPLLVVGTHSRTGSERFLVGSTAEEIVRRSERPVFTVSPHVRSYSRRKIRKILLATDLTQRSMAPLSVLASLWSSETRLTVIHVVNPDSPIVQKSWQDPIRNCLEQVLGHAAATDQVEFELITHEDVSKALHDAAVQHDADLIALGMHPAKALTTHVRPKTGVQIMMSAPCAAVSVCE